MRHLLDAALPVLLEQTGSGAVATLATGTPPANDDLANAQVITGMPDAGAGGPLTTEVLLMDATRENWEELYQYYGVQSVWYAWTPSESGKFALKLSPSNYTQILVFTAEGNARGISDFWLTGGMDELAFSGSAGKTYLFRISSDGWAYAPLTLTISNAAPAANDDFANRIVLPQDQTPSTPTVVEGSLKQTTCEPGENYYPGWQPSSVWYEWTAPADMVVRFELLAQGSAAIELYTSPDGSGALATLASVSEPGQAHAVTAGTRLYIRVTQAYQMTDLDFTLTVRNLGEFAHGGFAGREVLSWDTTVAGTVAGSDLEPGERLLHRWASPHSAWYEWTATETAPVEAATSLNGGWYVGVYEYNGTGEPTVSGLSLLTQGYLGTGWVAAAGHTYYLQVLPATDNPLTDFTLRVTAAGPAPENDRFENATVLAPTSQSRYGSVTWGTLDAGEPFEFQGPDGMPRYAERVVWYSWTAPLLSQVQVSIQEGVLFGLGVYTGDTLDTLQEVGSAMPLPIGTVGGELQNPAVVNFTARPQQTFMIAVGVERGSASPFMLNVDMIPLGPTDIALSGTTVQENQPYGTVVGTLTGTGAEPGRKSELTFRLVPGYGDYELFTIDGNELRGVIGFNYEARQAYAVKVRATDPDDLTFDKVFTINVADVNETPVLTRIPNQSVHEGEFLTLAITASDPDLPAQSLIYSLVSGPTGISVDPATGIFTWAPSESQGPCTYIIAVQVSDGALTAAWSFAVTVEETNIAPVLAPIADQSVAEGEQLAFAAIATDADIPTNYLAYSLIGAPDGAVINRTTGVLTWTPSETQGPGTYTITVLASDRSASSSRSFQVSVTEANAAPVLSDLSFSIPENEPTGTLVGTVSATDVDLPANPITYAIVSGNEAGRFAIDPVTGQLTLATPPDYEAQEIYTLTILASDADTGVTATARITVTDLPEFGLQQGRLRKFSLTEADGDLVTFALTGGGSGTLHPAGLITLTGTTPKSILSVSVKKSATGDGYYSLSGISAAGPLKGLSAGKVFVHGDITLNANASLVPTVPVAITLAGITDGSVDTGQALGSLKLQSWRDTDATPDQLIAPWIGAITAAGDWEADILTGSANAGVALKSLKVGGSIRQASLWAAGTLKSLAAKGAIANSRILAADGIASLTAASLADSDILVGVSESFPGHAATSFANPAAKLAKLTLTGQRLPKGQTHPAYLTNSHLSAPTYGTITLSNVPATTTTPILHVLTDTGTLKLTALNPQTFVYSGTWNALHPKPGQPQRPNLVAVVE